MTHCVPLCVFLSRCTFTERLKCKDTIFSLSSCLFGKSCLIHPLSKLLLHV